MHYNALPLHITITPGLITIELDEVFHCLE